MTNRHRNGYTIISEKSHLTIVWPNTHDECVSAWRGNRDSNSEWNPRNIAHLRSSPPRAKRNRTRLLWLYCNIVFRYDVFSRCCRRRFMRFLLTCGPSCRSNWFSLYYIFLIICYLVTCIKHFIRPSHRVKIYRRRHDLISLSLATGPEKDMVYSF